MLRLQGYPPALSAENASARPGALLKRSVLYAQGGCGEGGRGERKGRGMGQSGYIGSALPSGQNAWPRADDDTHPGQASRPEQTSPSHRQRMAAESPCHPPPRNAAV